VANPLEDTAEEVELPTSLEEATTAMQFIQISLAMAFEMKPKQV